MGHALEMAMGSNVTIKINSKDIPVIEGSIEYANMGLIPAGAYSNKNYIKDRVYFKDNIPKYLEDIMYDPQTSGGLLISVRKDRVSSLLKALENSPTQYGIVGEVCENAGYYLIVE